MPASKPKTDHMLDRQPLHPERFRSRPSSVVISGASLPLASLPFLLAGIYIIITSDSHSDNIPRLRCFIIEELLSSHIVFIFASCSTYHKDYNFPYGTFLSKRHGLPSHSRGCPALRPGSRSCRQKPQNTVADHSTTTAEVAWGCAAGCWNDH